MYTCIYVCMYVCIYICLSIYVSIFERLTGHRSMGKVTVPSSCTGMTDSLHLAMCCRIDFTDVNPGGSTCITDLLAPWTTAILLQPAINGVGPIQINAPQHEVHIVSGARGMRHPVQHLINCSLCPSSTIEFQHQRPRILNDSTRWKSTSWVSS